jgi:hypothetical protein
VAGRRAGICKSGCYRKKSSKFRDELYELTELEAAGDVPLFGTVNQIRGAKTGCPAGGAKKLWRLIAKKQQLAQPTNSTFPLNTPLRV